MDRELTKELVQKAIRIKGSQSALARACGVKQQNVWNWLNRDNKVPAKYALLIELATNQEVSRLALRPDVFQTHQHDD